ncbi:MAG: histone deacetylase [Chloroflexi bacterium]|nr:histone deacetylase [Chloroflexota bacterium]
MTTGYVYDPVFLEHDQAGHPESGQRLQAIMAKLTAHGLLDRLQAVPAAPLSLERLASVHDRHYLDRLRTLAERGGGHLDADTYVAAGSYSAALAAAGGTVALTEAVLRGDLANGFALVRPPGHHALRGRGMGFCLCNNLALAARAALDQGGLERVLLVDFDVHHGNGTQEAFYADPRALFFSTHQYPHYPGSGHWREIGEGPGQGYTVNVPLSAGVGDEGFTAIFDELLYPLAERFGPQLVLCSAGYDAHWQDPLARLLLSLGGYAALVRTLTSLAGELCGGRIVFVLEGGYQLEALAYGVLNTFSALLGRDEALDPLGPAPYAEADISDYLNQLRGLHRLV